MINIDTKVKFSVMLNHEETLQYIKQKIEMDYPDWIGIQVIGDYKYDEDTETNQWAGIIITASPRGNF